MSRINIYLPQDLKARMSKCPTVNWSKIAKEAFEDYLTAREERRKVFDFGLANAFDLRRRKD